MDITGRPWLVFDIETGPLPGCADFIPPIPDAVLDESPVEPNKGLVDPVKIAANLEQKRKARVTDWIEAQAKVEAKRAKLLADAALDHDLCEVAAIGWQLRVAADSPFECLYTQTRGTTHEPEMLDGFWRFVRSIQRDGGVIVGFNCLHFDLPILLRRSLYLGVETPAVNIDKYRHEGVIDVADVLTLGGKATWRSLGFYAKRFGIPHDDSVKGEDVPALVGRGAWDTVAAHVRADVATTAALAQRIGVIHQPQPAEAVA